MADLPLTASELTQLVDQMLAEDVGSGDITASATIPARANLTAAMTARQDMVIAGLPVAKAIFTQLVPDGRFDVKIADGKPARKGDVIAVLSGNGRGVLTAERSVLNITQHLSGVATLTRLYVDAIAGTRAKLLDTRKTIPGLRKLEKYAVRMGGGHNHRLGLFDAVLIKDNHIALAGGIVAAIRACKQAGAGPIEIEVDTLDQLKEALAEGVDSVLLDNMNPKMLREAVAVAAGRAKLEASGGVTLETIRGIAETGVDFISVGRLTQSAPAVDIGLDYMADG